MSVGTVIIGASHAGVQVASSLRDHGYEKPITLLDKGTALPYQRPPLSKGYLKDNLTDESLALRGKDFYKDKNISLNLGCEVTNIDKDKKLISFTRSNDQVEEHVSYENLVLAVGARARQLDETPSSSGAVTLRNLDDAKFLRETLSSAARVLIVGAGFIGLEVASTAAFLNKEVTLIDRGSRVLQRILPPVLSDYIEKAHRSAGSKFIFESKIENINKVGETNIELTLQSGAKLTGDLLLVCVGAEVNDDLAVSAGLECSNGIFTSEYGETSDASIFACGDCTRVISTDGKESHIESVQNAVDQSKNVAALIAGEIVKKPVAPWFWSDQLNFKLQMVGNTLDYDDLIVRGDRNEHKFSIVYYRGDTVVRVDSINRPADHLAARKLVSQGTKVPKEAAADSEVRLKTFN